MSKKSKKQSTLYYFHSVGCAYCKQIDPIVEKLNNEDYDILSLDISEKDNEGLHNEIKEKYKIDCGTPLLVDVDSGNNVCGWRGEDLIKKWADGEKIEPAPKPKSPPPQLPKSLDDDDDVKRWEKEYKKWTKENDHLPGILDSKSVLEKLKDFQKQQLQNPNPNTNDRISIIEQKLDKLMNHLGVK
jgi:hypothetical protein